MRELMRQAYSGNERPSRGEVPSMQCASLTAKEDCLPSKGNIVNNPNDGDERKTCEFTTFVGCHIFDGCRYE